MRDEAEAAVETAKGVLQDLVVVVSLVRTLAESFGSASELYRKLKRKSKSDSTDNEAEEKEKRHHRSSRKRRKSSPNSSRERDRDHHISWDLDPSNGDQSDSDAEAIRKSESQVLAVYERGYKELGEPYARGDSQNQLQAQIIELQRTLLAIHQDYMLSTYLAPSTSHSHLTRLFQSTQSARAAAVQALNLQYLRMSLDFKSSSSDKQRTIPGAFPLPLPEMQQIYDAPARRTSPSSISSATPSDDKNSMIQPYPPPQAKSHSGKRKLHCVYSKDLQNHVRLPLVDNYQAGGNNMCPFCHSFVNVKPGKVWQINLYSNDASGEHRGRTFLIKSRYIVKNHREDGGFACVLCERFREADTVCRDIRALMQHLWMDHKPEELEQDDDVIEIDDQHRG